MKIRSRYLLIIVCSLVSSFFAALTSNCAGSQATAPSPLILGSIQFPQVVTHLPLCRIYFLGKTIPCETHPTDRKVTFDLPLQRSYQKLYLLITESIDYALKKNQLFEQMQTIDHIKVPDQQAYKFYRLKLVHDADHPDVCYWDIHAKTLPENSRRVPDETIIVLYTPDYVKTVAGGTTLELPTIVIKSDVVDRAGSQSALLDQAITLQLASLNSDTIHAPLKHAIKQIGHKTLIAPTA